MARAVIPAAASGGVWHALVSRFANGKKTTADKWAAPHAPEQPVRSLIADLQHGTWRATRNGGNRVKRSDTMVTVEKLGGSWLIVRTAADQSDAASGDSDSDLSADRLFWSGTGWSGQYGFAQQFLTREDAQAYLAEHQHEMV
jgi:hypothetical protein